jgi:hypothetical protein
MSEVETLVKTLSGLWWRAMAIQKGGKGGDPPGWMDY